MTLKQVSPVIAIYGSLRSGTTLLRLMVDAHPKLSCPGETDFIFDCLIPSAESPRYDIQELEGNRIYRSHEEKYRAKPLPTPTPESFIERITEEGSTTAVLVLHRNLSQALDVYPDLRVIHLVRDPRDVARSSIGMGWAGHVYYGVDHWIGTERDWQACRNRMAPDQSLTVAYEELIAHPEEILGKIAAFAGYSYSPSMLEYDADSTYAKPDPNLTLQWKRKQTPHEVGLVEGKVGPLLNAAGYTPSGYPEIHPTVATKAELWLRNKRAIWVMRFSRHGVRDSLIVSLSRKLGISFLGRGARRRMEHTDLEHLK